MSRSEVPHISVVIPVYGSPESIHELCLRLRTSLEPLDSSFEVLLVNDASPDDSWIRIELEVQSDSRFVGINLSRNFGQHAAISAGLAASQGEWIVVMDCDLQDRPEEIPRLYERTRQGFEQVVAIRTNRNDSWFKRFTSSTYASLLSYLSGQHVNAAVGNFGIYHRRVIDVINSLTEHGRTFGLLALWTGFRRTEIEVQHDARKYGKSSYSIRGLISHATTGVVSYSDKPLRFTVGLGTSIAALSMVAGAIIFIRGVMGQTASGWASITVLMTFSTGVTLLSLGIVGLYVGRVLDEVKHRPAFIVSERTDNNSVNSSRNSVPFGSH